MLKLRERFSIVFVCLAAFCILCLSYAICVSPLFGYAGFAFAASSPRILLAIFAVLFLSLITPLNDERPSSYLSAMLVMAVLPVTVLYAIGDQSTLAFGCMFAQASIVILISRPRLVLTNTIHCPNYQPIVFFAVLMVFTSLIVVLLRGGLGSLNFKISEVYFFRDKATSVMFSGIMGYLTNWVFKVIMPFLFAFCLHGKKIRWFVILCLVQFLFYGLSSQKSALAAPLVPVAIFFIIKTKRPVVALFGIAIAAVCVSLVAYSVFDDRVVASYLLRRSIFFPSLLDYKYYEFFSINPHVEMSNGFLSGLQNYPYDMKPSLLIGKFIGQPQMSANTGFLATSYMHFGVIGVIVFGIVTGALLRLVDSLSRRLDTEIVLSIITLPFVFLFTSSDLTTTIGTHGLGFSIILLSTLPQRRDASRLSK